MMVTVSTKKLVRRKGDCAVVGFRMMKYALKNKQQNHTKRLIRGKETWALILSRRRR